MKVCVQGAGARGERREVRVRECGCRGVSVLEVVREVCECEGMRVSEGLTHSI
jgi:hypothetical protein